MNEAKEAAGFKTVSKTSCKTTINQQKYQWTQCAKQMAAFKGDRSAPGRQHSKLFNHLPKTKLEIKPVPPEREEDRRRGMVQRLARQMRQARHFRQYQARTGFVYLEMESNYVQRHAGHRFQISLKQEQQNVPQVENSLKSMALKGWALYVESVCQSWRCARPITTLWPVE